MSTIGVFIKGYDYFKYKFAKEKSNIIKTRLLLKKTMVIKGEEAAKLFYDQEKFKRKNATPSRFKKTLFGIGGVQGLDGKAHYNRKKMFMKIMSRELMDELDQHFTHCWKNALIEWQTRNMVILFDEVEKILFLAACKWVGVPLLEEEIEKRTRYLSNMIDAAGGIGIRHYKGRYSRKKAESWIEKLVEYIRMKKDNNNSILSQFCFYEDVNNQLLNKRIVVVEILNLLRPIVAIARYIIFSAMALHEHQGYGKKIERNQNDERRKFVQEVRRMYPFFPFVPAKVKKDFIWKDVLFPKNRRVLLDLYATNHDEEIWKNPDKFYPERFNDWDESPFNFIPQGGGDHYKNHRCAGEWITIRLTELALGFLVNKMNYIVPRQNLNVKLNRIPAIPKSRFKIKMQNSIK